MQAELALAAGDARAAVQDAHGIHGPHGLAAGQREADQQQAA